MILPRPIRRRKMTKKMTRKTTKKMTKKTRLIEVAAAAKFRPRGTEVHVPTERRKEKRSAKRKEEKGGKGRKRKGINASEKGESGRRKGKEKPTNDASKRKWRGE